MAQQKNSSPRQEGIQVLELVGCFLTFFGILLLIAAATGDTAVGRLTNLLCAMILLALGVGMFSRGVIRHRGPWALPLIVFGALALASTVVALCLSPSTLQARGEFYITFVSALKSAGSLMRGVVASIPHVWVKIFTAVGFLVIAAVVWLVRRETVYYEVTERKWWRDLRLWTAVIIATQIVIYLLLGT